MLEVKGVAAGYRGVLAVQDVSLTVGRGDVVSLVGSNGAGKSTLLRTIAGLMRPLRGEIRLDGQPIHVLPAYEIVKKRIALIPEGRQLFGRLSVWDNLLLGAYTLHSSKAIEESLREVLQLFPWIEQRKKQRTETLSGGEQQQVAIARGLMSRPSLLMLDEPSLGIMPKLVSEIFERIHQIRQKGVTVFLVEQNVYEALSVSDRAYVLQSGRIVLEGTGEELLRSDLVRQAYLGM